MNNKLAKTAQQIVLNVSLLFNKTPK